MVIFYSIHLLYILNLLKHLWIRSGEFALLNAYHKHILGSVLGANKLKHVGFVTVCFHNKRAKAIG